MPGVNDTPRKTCAFAAVCIVWKASPVAGEVALGWSVIVTSLFGSAPWSPLPLTVEVMAQIVTEPSELTRPALAQTGPGRRCWAARCWGGHFP